MKEIERLEDIMRTIEDYSRDYNHFNKLDQILSDEHHQAEEKSLYIRDSNRRMIDHSDKYKDLPNNASIKRKKYHYDGFTDNFKKDINDQIRRLNRAINS